MPGQLSSPMLVQLSNTWPGQLQNPLLSQLQNHWPFHAVAFSWIVSHVNKSLLLLCQFKMLAIVTPACGNCHSGNCSCHWLHWLSLLVNLLLAYVLVYFLANVVWHTSLTIFSLTNVPAICLQMNLLVFDRLANVFLAHIPLSIFSLENVPVIFLQKTFWDLSL